MMPKRFGVEFLIALFSFCAYCAIGFLFAFNTQLVYHPDYICDLYYGFDNAYHATSFVRHPLLKLFSEAFNFLFGKTQTEVISALLVIICSALLSVQNLFVFKILNQIVVLSKKFSVLLTVAFGLLGSNLLLSFTFDSYVFSGCFLTMFFFYFLKAEKDKKRMTPQSLFLFSFLVGGITITNFAKIAIVSLYSSFRKSYYKVILGISGLIVIGYLSFFNQVKASILFISKHADVQNSLLRNVSDYFFGSSFLIPSAKISEINYINGTKMHAIIGEHNSISELILLIVLAIVLLFAILKNIQNKIVQFLMLSFSVDVLIHVIFGLGLREAYIFSGNFSFIWPIILGIGYQSLSSEPVKKLYIFGLFILFGIFLFLNIKTLSAVYHFGLNYYSI